MRDFCVILVATTLRGSKSQEEDVWKIGQESPLLGARGFSFAACRLQTAILITG